MKLVRYIKKIPGVVAAHRFYEGTVRGRIRRVNRNTPRIVNIELTTACNSKCMYCGREKLLGEGTRKIGSIDFTLFEKIVHDISRLPRLPEKIVPVGLGETLLYPKIVEVARLIKHNLPTVILRLSTNGIHFPGELQQELIDAGVDELVISVNFHSRLHYTKHNGVDEWETVVANAENFLALKGDRKPATTVQILDIAENSSDVRKFETYWAKRMSRRDRVLIRPFNDFGGTIDVNDYIQPAVAAKRYPCAAIFDHLMINCEGFCFPCCMGITAANDDNLCIGNVNKQSVVSMFEPGARVQHIRRLHKTGVYRELPKCATCGTWRFGPNLFFKIGSRWV
jgi:pyruvate-formate lyase-activating enzyme